MPREAVLGVLSLILWALIIIVTCKYVLILLRADNRGEGGTLALMALAQGALSRRAGVMALCGIVSAALQLGRSSRVSFLPATRRLLIVVNNKSKCRRPGLFCHISFRCLHRLGSDRKRCFERG